MDSRQDNTHSNQETKSVLNKVYSNSNRENNDSNPLDNLIPSDADTERMGEEADHGNQHPKLEELAENKRSVTDTEDKEEPESKSLKRPKRDSQAPEIPDEEGDVEEEEEEAEEESSEQKTTTVKDPGASAGVDADADVDVEEEEEIEEMGEEEDEGDSKERDVSKRISSMQSPIEVEEQRQTALQEITDIEYKFAELRQRLFENKMLRLKTELQMCMEGSHPRLQTYYQKIASIRDHKLKRAYQRQKYNMQCIDTETRATRTHIHQDFLKKVSDLRSRMLTDTTQTWYDINKERREMDIVVPEVNYHVPVKLAGKTLSCITGYAGPAQQRFPGEPLPEDLECENITFRYRSNAVDKLEVIVDRMRLNNELSDLEGLRRYFNGFPGAPNLSGLRDSEIYEDLLRLQGR